MNKNELAKALTARTKAPVDITNEFLDTLFSTIAEELQQGHKVSLANFGTFYLVRHKDRITAHPTSKEPVNLPAQSLAKWRPSSKLKDTINRPD